MLGGDTAVLADGGDQGGGCTESDPPEERAGRFQQMGQRGAAHSVAGR